MDRRQMYAIPSGNFLLMGDLQEGHSSELAARNHINGIIDWLMAD
jgi:hypothetical protein